MIASFPAQRGLASNWMAKTRIRRRNQFIFIAAWRGVGGGGCDRLWRRDFRPGWRIRRVQAKTGENALVPAVICPLKCARAQRAMKRRPHSHSMVAGGFEDMS